MRTTILVLFSFLFVNVVLLANPFVGKWQADFVTVVADGSTMTVTIDSDDPDYKSLEGTHTYTYDDNVLRVGDFVAVYEVSEDGNMLVAIGLLKESDNWLKVRFTKQQFQKQDGSFSS